MNENYHFLFEYLKKEQITIDRNEFLFQIQSHPESPSLLAISETFDYFGIQNLATRIEKEDITGLPDHFIALLKEESAPFLAFIERLENGFRYTHKDKPVIVDPEEFDTIFQNIVLLAEQEEGESTTTKNNIFSWALIPLGTIYLASVFINGFSLLHFILVLLLVIGVYLSVEALSHELGIKSKLSETVCNLTTNTDCDAVINGKKSKIMELINFSDSSFVFFSGQLLALLFLTISNQTTAFYTITTTLLLLSLPITIASIYQQWFVVKKWCPICLAIIVVIYLELFSFLYFKGFNLAINTKSIVYYLFALTVCFLMTYFSKKTFKTNFEFQSKIFEGNRFKRNYSLFKLALLASERVNNRDVDSGNIILGNPEAKLKMMVISSPFCSHCVEVHKNIEAILKQHKETISIAIRFNFNATLADEKSRMVHHNLVNQYLANGQDAFRKSFHDWFENKDIEKIKIDVNCQATEFLHAQFLWNQENSITFTPAIIINGYQFPKEYNRNDFIYFINDLVEDKDFLAL